MNQPTALALALLALHGTAHAQDAPPAPSPAQSPAEAPQAERDNALFGGPPRRLGTSPLQHSTELLAAERLGEQFVTVTRTGQVGFWAREGGAAIGELGLGDVAVGAAPDGAGGLLVALRAGGIVRLDPDSREAQPFANGEAGLIRADVGGERIALAADLSGVRLLDAGGAELGAWEFPRTLFTGGEFDAEGRLLLLGVDRERLFGRSTGEGRPTTRLIVITADEQAPGELALLPDTRADAFGVLPGGAIVVGDDRGRLSVFDAATAERTAERQVGLKSILSLRVEPSGEGFWTLDSGGRVRRHAAETLEDLGGFDLPLPLPQSWALAEGKGPEGGAGHLFARNIRAEVRAGDGAVLLAASGHLAPVSGLDFDSTGGRLVSGSFDGTAIVWDLDSNAPVASFTEHDGFVYDVAFSPSDERIASAGKDGTVRVWSPGGAGEARAFSEHTAAVCDILWGTDDSMVVSVGGDSQVIGWDLESGSPGWIQEVDPGVLFKLAPLGERVVVAESTCASFDLASGRRTSEPARYGAPALSAAGVGLRAALGLADGHVQLIELEGDTLRPTSRLGPHGGRVEACALDPTGPLLAAAGGTTVRLWDLDGEALGELGPLDAPVMSLAFSPDGQHLAAGTQSGAIFLWRR